MTLEINRGMRVRIIGDHPWTGETAKVITGPDGLLKNYRLTLIRDDAMDGHEIYCPLRNMEPAPER